MDLSEEGAPPGASPVVSATGTRRGRRPGRWAGRRLLIAVAVVIWVGAVVYPDPRPFVTSVARLKQPPVDAQAVSGVAPGLPDDYAAIEKFSDDYVTFEPAWTVYGLPWYFPTVGEVLRDHAGDCQAEAVLTASILEAKGMPYTLRYSFDHVWVDYPGKNATALEDAATSFVSDSGKGWLASLPDRIPLRSIVEQRVAYHWTPMPLFQKAILLLGVLLIIGYGERRLLGRVKRALWPERGPVVSSGSP
jgi:hypothetical protein